MILLGILFATARCNDPKEPDVDICVIQDDKSMYCIPQQGTRPEYELDIDDSLGFFCTNSDGYAQMKTHHEQLHLIIDEGKRIGVTADR